MGINCCTNAKERFDLNMNEDSCEIESSSMLTRRAIKSIRAISVHNSKETVSGKVNSISPHNEDAAIENPPDETEIVNPKAFLLKPSTSILRCPTNFKIEPLYFRREHRKESLDDRYSTGEIIGKGAFGIVKKVKDVFTGSFRALKVISKKNCQQTDNFADEINIIKKLVYNIIFDRIILTLYVSMNFIKTMNTIT